MKKLGLFFAILLMLVCFLGTGCGDGEKGTSEPTSAPTATSTSYPTSDNIHITLESSKQAALEIFKYIPIEFQRARYVNLAAFRENTSLDQYYEEITEDVGASLAASGIELNEIDHIGFVGDHVALYYGQHDFERIHQTLTDQNYSQSTYLDVDIWRSDDPEKGIITLLQPTCVLVTSDYEEAEQCIATIGNWGDSLYDDENGVAVLTKFPEDALRVDIVLGGESGLLATGKSVELLENNTTRMIEVARFRDESSAIHGVLDIAQEFDTWARVWNIYNVETIQINRFVKSSGLAMIADVVNPLGYPVYWLY